MFYFCCTFVHCFNYSCWHREQTRPSSALELKWIIIGNMSNKRTNKSGSNMFELFMLPVFCRLNYLIFFLSFLQFLKVIIYAKNFWSWDALWTGKGNKHVFNMLPITQYGAACVVQCVRNALHIFVQYLPSRIAREKIMHGSSEVQPCYQYLHLEYNNTI